MYVLLPLGVASLNNLKLRRWISRNGTPLQEWPHLPEYKLIPVSPCPPKPRLMNDTRNRSGGLREGSGPSFKLGVDSEILTKILRHADAVAPVAWRERTRDLPSGNYHYNVRRSGVQTSVGLCDLLFGHGQVVA